ncbi:auxin-responsive protein SAUR68-like [Diospyros lotus]|uniref:auxin-responsive protein SAUR68-like n=1 Tax=Diospyros lotus TaxID=55363 RepID=UPI002251B287|nr:auxin-responsive protein SAUR68-like [Diospyros lotus]
MISSKKLVKMARKWQKLAAITPKRITSPITKEAVAAGHCSPSTVDKGHFVVYSADGTRFVIPLAYLSKEVVRELLKMAEEEYGLPSHGPITLPFDAIFFEYALSLIKRNASEELQGALLLSITSSRCLSFQNHQQGQSNQQLVCSF